MKVTFTTISEIYFSRVRIYLFCTCSLNSALLGDFSNEFKEKKGKNKRNQVPFFSLLSLSLGVNPITGI